MMSWAALLMALQPSSRRPLPLSRSSTTSNLEMQRRSGGFFGLQTSVLHFRYCSRCAECHSAQDPWPFAAVFSLRTRKAKPLSQALLQVLHGVQGASSQSASQAAVPQLLASVVVSQGRPPCFASILTWRTRSCMPPSHSALQELHPPQSPSLQSTGHSCTLHGTVFFRIPHSMPRLGFTTMYRSIVCDPPPQEALQEPGAQSESSQSWMKVSLGSPAAAPETWRSSLLFFVDCSL
mmetsp:Transcript_13453/g.29484  ORF Transcript_13453/g.29484 Transcript_13453/m.29484 type:complete len:236 (+) Transcript_13453:625-1332(+)